MIVQGVPTDLVMLTWRLGEMEEMTDWKETALLRTLRAKLVTGVVIEAR